MNAQNETQRKERDYPEVRLYKALCWGKEKHLMSKCGVREKCSQIKG